MRILKRFSCSTLFTCSAWKIEKRCWQKESVWCTINWPFKSLWLPHKLIIAELNAFGLNLSTLKLMHSYLSNRKQRTKVNHAYISCEEILFGVPQDSILRSILFNIFLSDLFLVINHTDFFSYADDNTIYDSGNSTDDLI